jgi:hypothetical protein
MFFMGNTLLAFNASVGLESLFSQRSPTDPIPKAIQKLWQLTMEGSLYNLLVSFAGGIVVFGVAFWCLKFYQSLDDNGLRPTVNQLIYPVILVILLANGGENMRRLTMTTRDVMNNMNSLVNQVVSAEVSIKSANLALSNNFLASLAANISYRACVASPYPERIVGCLATARAAADALVGERLPGVTNSAEFQTQLDTWKNSQLGSNARRANDAMRVVATQNPAPVNPAPGATTPPSAAASATTSSAAPPSILDAEYYTSQSSLNSVVSTIMSFRKGFTYIIEIMMLVTGLVGPIFLGLSLFPSGTRPLIAWGTSFLSLGFCKICYSLISGLSSIAFVYAGPENTDMTVVAVVLGILSPVLAFSIASGSGIGALNTISPSAQAGGIGNGIGFYKPDKKE